MTGKIMGILFFSSQGVCSTNMSSPQGITENSQYYCCVLQTFIHHIGYKPSEMKKCWILHQDNALPHSARARQDFFQAKGVEDMEHPLYSPDLTPGDFYLFPALKYEFRGVQFPSDASVATAVQRFSKPSPDDFMKTFTNWRLVLSLFKILVA